MPKPGWMVRPGSVLDYRDEVIFNALLGAISSQFWEILKGSQGVTDMAYQMNPPTDAVEWMQPAFLGWKQWTKKSLEMLQSGATYVVVADIAGFYDNINLPLFSQS
ncbi:MAG: hypothetical protein IPP68_09935 [Elusimicrobia bacterium]|nr:hypothetical protein [Elusimicrobiota bacterium]